MEYKIETLHPKKLVGRHITNSFANDQTFQLWSGFMPRRREIQNMAGTDLYSLQIYSPGFFERFDAHAPFEKWAAVEVTGFDKVPHGMETFLLPGGLYAVFHYKGLPAAGASAFQYILGSWMPASEYILDTRPHFEILGEKYNNNSPESEEDIWIPIRPR